MRLLLTTFFLFTLTNAKYLSNKSCKECHEEIFNEYQTSLHSKGYFNDSLHRKIADKVSSKKYGCAVCHMPMADNLKDLMSGKARPDIKNPTHTDAISCYFCHTIAYVKKSHKFFLNVKAKEVEGMKPSFYGTLNNPDHSDKHDGLKNPIYTKNVCKGCHAYKINDYNTTVFRAMKDKESTQSCIKCHMPSVNGGNEKINRRFRKTHHSHKFLSLKDKEFRSTGVDINVIYKGSELQIFIKNKMPHPLIIQSARVKYIEATLFKDGKIVWQNYKKSPSEDKEGYFSSFYKKNGKRIIIPNLATSSKFNNIEGNSTKVLRYKVPSGAESLDVSLFAILAKRECSKIIKDLDINYTKPILIKSIKVKINK